MKVRSELKQFAEAMEAKLATHDDDREDSWRLETTKWLHTRFREECDELQEAFDDCDPEAARRECIDVANFALFMWHKLGRKTKT